MTQSDKQPEGVGSLRDGPETQETPSSRIDQTAAGVTGKAKDTARRLFSAGAERIGNSGHSASSALRRAAAECDDAWVSTALRRSADGIEAATERLAGRDIDDIVEDLDALARRRPALFLGASLALGFVAARLAKTALEQAREGDQPPSDPAYQGLQPGL